MDRGLKPGNVWLTSDGVANIGDFGLAVAEGRSRLMQHGMMVWLEPSVGTRASRAIC